MWFLYHIWKVLQSEQNEYTSNNFDVYSREVIDVFSVGHVSQLVENKPWCHPLWLTGLKAPTK